MNRRAPSQILPLLLAFVLVPAYGGNSITKDASGRIEVRAYDAKGKLIVTTDATGKATPIGRAGTGAVTGQLTTNPPPASPRVAPAAARTIHVPADQPTIQAAINAANNGDTVLVAAGVYKENINFAGKAITVKSASGPKSTTIDGGAVDSVVTFNSGETLASVLKGFTITNGYAQFQGGGIYVASSAPTITGNVITKNIGCAGSGISVQFGGPLIQNNTISSNVQGGCTGGTGGGGIGVGGASDGTRIIKNRITGNSSTNSFGGGGISLFAAGAPVIENNTIDSNDGGSAGGGLVTANDTNAVVAQNLFTNNTAFQGGGIYWLIPVSSPGLVLVNNTVVGNSSTNGSAIFDGGFDTNMTIENNLLIGQAGQAAYLCDQLNGSTTPAIFAYNDVYAAGGAAIAGSCAITTTRDGNMSVDPKFVNATARNLHLQSGSAAIDAGNSAAPDLPARDLDGFVRVNGASVDLGAYETYAGSISIAPSFLSFASQKIGTSSAAKPLQVSNSGSVPLFLGIRTSGDFRQTNNCTSRLNAGASCTIKVVFKPKAVGSRTGSVLVADNASGSPQSVPLSGTGSR